MSWADKVKATALAALAERTATGARLFAATTPDWQVDEVWLTRAKQPHAQATRSAMDGQSNPSQRSTAARN
jgi:hypothetical protein